MARTLTRHKMRGERRTSRRAAVLNPVTGALSALVFMLVPLWAARAMGAYVHRLSDNRSAG